MGCFLNRAYMLRHKTKFSKFQKIEILHEIFPDHNIIRNNKNIPRIISRYLEMNTLQILYDD